MLSRIPRTRIFEKSKRVYVSCWERVRNSILYAYVPTYIFLETNISTSYKKHVRFIRDFGFTCETVFLQKTVKSKNSLEKSFLLFFWDNQWVFVLFIVRYYDTFFYFFTWTASEKSLVYFFLFVFETCAIKSGDSIIEHRLSSRTP